MQNAVLLRLRDREERPRAIQQPQASGPSTKLGTALSLLILRGARVHAEFAKVSKGDRRTLRRK